MEHFLEKLRQKPEAHKMRIVLIVAAAVTGIIFLVWLSVLGVRFKNNEDSEVTRNSEPAFVEIKEEFSDAYEAGKSQFEEMKEELTNIIQ